MLQTPLFGGHYAVREALEVVFSGCLDVCRSCTRIRRSHPCYGVRHGPLHPLGCNCCSLSSIDDASDWRCFVEVFRRAHQLFP